MSSARERREASGGVALPAPSPKPSSSSLDSPEELASARGTVFWRLVTRVEGLADEDGGGDGRRGMVMRGGTHVPRSDQLKKNVDSDY